MLSLAQQMRNKISNDKFTKPCRNRRKVLPNCNAKRISNAPVLAGLENIPPPQDSERSAHLCRFSRPNVPASISAVSSAKRRFFRAVSDADSFWVCALASPNAVGTARDKTRGFTSCSFFLNFRRNKKSEMTTWREPVGL